MIEIEVVRNTLLLYIEGRGNRWSKRKKRVEYKIQDFDLGNWKNGGCHSVKWRRLGEEEV